MPLGGCRPQHKYAANGCLFGQSAANPIREPESEFFMRILHHRAVLAAGVLAMLLSAPAIFAQRGGGARAGAATAGATSKPGIGATNFGPAGLTLANAGNAGFFMGGINSTVPTPGNQLIPGLGAGAMGPGIANPAGTNTGNQLVPGLGAGPMGPGGINSGTFGAMNQGTAGIVPGGFVPGQLQTGQTLSPLQQRPTQQPRIQNGRIPGR